MEHELYIMLAESINLTRKNNEILEALFAKLQEEAAEAKTDEVVVDAKKK